MNSDRMGLGRTCDTDTVNVFRYNSLPLDNLVELGTSTVQNDGVESNTVQETNAEGQFIQLVQDCTSDFDDGEFCRLRGIGRGREDAQMTFDFTFGANRI